ncbi:hypothetical protein B7483_022025 [Escherichia coli]|nr:lipocalin family protein [Escherichia coli]MBV7241729.1 hypothetical protein [Escherichia coli]
MRILPVVAAVTAAFLVVACSSPTPPKGVTVVNNFDAKRYLGTWYEIARFDHRFERGLDKVTATYSLRDDGGINVINKGYNPDREMWQKTDIRDEESRRTFATEHAPVGIQSVDYSFTVGNKTFTVIVRGNDSNSFDTPEDNHPPVLAFTCETAQFDTRHDWDTFIALVRLMNAVHNGEESKCHAGTHTRLGRRMDSEKPWSLFLGRLQLLLKDSELKDMAVEFHKLVNGDAANVIKQIRLLYGEG